MKIPKTFRTGKDLEKKMRQLVAYAKEPLKEPTIPHWTEVVNLMSSRLAFYKGERTEASDVRSRYLFEEDGFIIDYIMQIEPKTLEILDSETYVFDNNMLVLRAINDEIDAYIQKGWKEELESIYYRHFAKGF